MCRTANTERGRAGAAAGLKPRLAGWLLAGAALLAPMLATAADYRSVGVAAAILYDGPSVKGRKLFVAPRGMPVEVLSEVNQWVKVREQGGDVLWIEKKDLTTARSPVAVANAIVRAAPQDGAPIATQLERGVPLVGVEGNVPAGWLRVRLPDGTSGYVRAGDVWGL